MVGALGPEPLADDFTLDAFRARLARRSGALKPLLLNQAFIAGIGNISAQILCGAHKNHLVGSPGTLGTQLRMPALRVRQYSWSPESMLVMSTDGMRPEWKLSAYPGLSGHEPTVVSAALHRDFTRTSDDAAVLVVTESG